MDESNFNNAVDASQVLYKSIVSKVDHALPPTRFLAGRTPCFRPSALMLTSLEMTPDAVAAVIPPLYNIDPFDAAIRAGHGRYASTSDNEVLYFRDELTENNYSHFSFKGLPLCS